MARPSLGFEYEIALALVDTTAGMTFDETPYPAIVGDFEVVSCTRTASCQEPVDQTKNIRCGYNPAAHKIPAPSIPGALEWTSWDKAEEDAVRAYHGKLCVARVRASNDNNISFVRTIYCNYFTPAVTIHAPEGESEGYLTVSGEFTRLTTV